MSGDFPPGRYTGKPFLKLVDSWLLDCIGQLDDHTRDLLDSMTPTLRATYASEGTWQDIVRTQVGFAPGVEQAIRELWDKNRDIARAGGVELTPAHFVEMFVEENVST